MYVIKRTPQNPILTPNREHYWEAAAAFNMCPVREAKGGKKIYAVYRAISAPDPLREPRQISTVGIAESLDGEHFKNHRQLFTPEEPWERYGCEDPRITFFEGKYYIFYTALSTYPFGPEGIRVAVAVSSDLKTVTERHLVTPFNAKAMTLFPERINGKITVIFSAHTDTPPAKVAIVQVDDIEEFWSPEFWNRWHGSFNASLATGSASGLAGVAGNYLLEDPRRTSYDHIEVGAPPVKTPHGWLFIYSHIQNYFPNPDHFEHIFGIEALLLDINDPHKIIGRTSGPMLAPGELYELSGDVANVIFPTGAFVDEEKDILTIYYGAADTTCCSAKVSLHDLLGTMSPLTSVDWHFTRSPKNPIIEPITDDPKIDNLWQSKATFNPAAVELADEDGKNPKIYLLYRALSDKNTSTIGCAILKSDGVTVEERFPKPIYIAREPFEMKGRPGENSGCEDPRVTRIGERLYMCYTAYNGVDAPRVAVTSINVADFLTRDWSKWAEPVLISPAGIDDKDACIFPEKIGAGKNGNGERNSNGNYFILHRIGEEICGYYVDTLNFKEGEINRCLGVLAPRHGKWDSAKVGISAPPMKTPHGWLLLYHGISRQHHTYRVGAALLDLNDPTLVLARSADPILEPKEPYELSGIVNIVVFPCGMVVLKNKKGGKAGKSTESGKNEDELFIYYGAADRVVGAASMKLDILLGALERGAKLC